MGSSQHQTGRDKKQFYNSFPVSYSCQDSRSQRVAAFSDAVSFREKRYHVPPQSHQAGIAVLVDFLALYEFSQSSFSVALLCLLRLPSQQCYRGVVPRSI